MSRIEELIKEKCPDGVEYRTIESVIELMQPKIKIKSNDYLQCGKYPVIDQGKEFIGGYTNEETPFLKDEYVIFGDHTCVVKYIDFEFVQGADGVKVLKADKTVILPRYLYHCMTAIKMVVDYARHWSKMKIEEIPVPPIEVQQEIVRILDKFTELEAELQVELNARKKQYGEYLNLLMDFSNNDSIKYMSVGELFEIKNGLNKEKEAFGKGKPIINFTDVFKKRYLVNGNFFGLVDVNEEEIERYSAKKGDVFFTRTSETREDIGMSSTLIEDVEGCVFSGFVLRARPLTNLLLPKFCSYYFSTNHVRRTIMRYASFTTRATTTGPKLAKIMVPILPISEQQKIVDILDRMDAICNDYEKGLPAEIEARHKQYEFYRDKLLAFERKVV